MAQSVAHAVLRPLVLSSQDPIDIRTGAHSQRSFSDWLAAALALRARQRSPVSVVRFDLDEIEHVNGSFGRHVGDAVLRIVSTAVQRLLHRKDVLARHGDDAFVVFVQGVSSRNAAILAERIRATVSDLPLVAQGKNFRVTVSVGVAWVDAAEPQHGHTLIETAERALREAKSSGRNRVSIAIVE
jgi:diguanylate cyclase (GGDEF)-like protein